MQVHPTSIMCYTCIEHVTIHRFALWDILSVAGSCVKTSGKPTVEGTDGARKNCEF